MKTKTLLTSRQNIPIQLQQEITRNFPGKPLNELTIRYYETVEDVGKEYFTKTVLSACKEDAAVRYLEPFICFVRLGEALILSQNGCVVYDDRVNNDSCTETGPFWFVTLNQPETKLGNK